MERFEGNGRYHNVIRHNDLLFFSGQTATEAGNDLRGQTQMTLAKIDHLLEKYGSDRANILHADVYPREQEDVKVFNEVWDQWAPKEKEPTRACMIAKLGREPILVEIVIIAAVVGSKEK